MISHPNSLIDFEQESLHSLSKAKDFGFYSECLIADFVKIWQNQLLYVGICNIYN